MRALLRFSIREVVSRPGRATLTLLSIVIGVAAVVAVTISTQTTRRAYRQMFASVSGKAALEVEAEAGGGLDEKLLDVVAQTPGVAAAVPLIQRPTVLIFRGQRVTVIALGIDLQKDSAVRDYTIAKGRPLSEQPGALLEAHFAEQLGIEPGDEIRLLTARSSVVGLVKPRGTASSFSLAGMVLLPLSQAQAIFGARGRIDLIQVVVDEKADPKQVMARVAELLPPGAVVRPPLTRTAQLEETLLSTEEGLRLATAFSLLLAAFIILNTFLMNVGERRQKLAILRAVGATRGQVCNMILAESLVMGLVGVVLGIAVGLLGALLLSESLNSLLQVTLPPIEITPLVIFLAVVFGLGIALVGAAVPARRAAQVPPLEGMGAIPREDTERASHKIALFGAALCAVSSAALAGCILGWLPMYLAVGTGVALLLGTVMLLEPVLGAVSGGLMWLLGPLLRTEGRLAHRQVLRRRSRSTLTVGVLFVASSTGVGLASAILDSIQDVRRWYEQVIVGDFIIRAMMPDMATGLSAALPDELGQQLRSLPGLRSVDSARFMTITAADRQCTLIVRDFSFHQPVYFDLRANGDPKQVIQRLFAGEAVIGSVLAQRTGLGVGDLLPVKTTGGPHTVRIAGITNDYLVGGLGIYMERQAARKLFNIEGADGYLIFVEPDAMPAIQQQLQQLCEKYGALLHSGADIRRMIDGMIRGVHGCLWGILVLGFVVAAFGVVNTLTMNVLEQTRELGLLRIVAMTRSQVRKTIFSQAVIIGFIGLGPGTLVGVSVAYLINLAMTPALGHPVEFTFRPALLAASFAAGFVMVVAAAWFPAERAARLDLTKALQYE